LMFVDAVALSVFSNMHAELTVMLGFALENNKKVFCCLFDRGYYDSKVIGILNKMKMKYLMLVPKKMKKLLDEHKKDKFFVVEKYLVGKSKTETKLVVYKDERFDWVFATNMKFHDALNMIKLYKKRWNIETGFRVCDEARVKTKSMRIVVRYFLFLCGIVLYNLWKEVYPEISFKKLIQIIANEHVRKEGFGNGFLCGHLTGLNVLCIGMANVSAFTYACFYRNECYSYDSPFYSYSNNGLAPVVC
jgi:hypothetical protein